MPTDHHVDAAAASPSRATGPVTAEGKARSAMNATRHGVCAAKPIPGPGDDADQLDALRVALVARHRPHDAAEAHWVEELVFVVWRQERLRALEAAVLERAMTPQTEADAPALPSLSTVIRYRARLDRDWRHAVEALDQLRYARKRALPPARLHTMADMLARAARTNEPTGLAGPPPPATNELRHPVPDLPEEGMNEPLPNRHERRRLAALARARHAA